MTNETIGLHKSILPISEKLIKFHKYNSLAFNISLTVILVLWLNMDDRLSRDYIKYSWVEISMIMIK